MIELIDKKRFYKVNIDKTNSNENSICINFKLDEKYDFCIFLSKYNGKWVPQYACHWFESYDIDCPLCGTKRRNRAICKKIESQIKHIYRIIEEYPEVRMYLLFQV
jgi:hypothetical protein